MLELHPHELADIRNLLQDFVDDVVEVKESTDAKTGEIVIDDVDFLPVGDARLRELLDRIDEIITRHYEREWDEKVGPNLRVAAAVTTDRVLRAIRGEGCDAAANSN